MNAQRRKRIQTIIEQIERLAHDLQELAADEQSAIDNLPENMQSGEKADKMEESVSIIEDAASDLENAKDNLLAME